MKRFLIYPAILLLFHATVQAEPAVQLGDSKEQVIQIMGEPTSYMKMGGQENLRYLRGSITIKSNEVVAVSVESKADFRQRLLREKEERLLALEEKKGYEAERFTKGSQIKTKMLESSDYVIASAEQKVKWWRTFAKKYPKVDIKEPYLVALKQYEEDKESAEEIAQYEQRIKSLEQKLASSEWDKKEAERKAQVEKNLWPQQTVHYRTAVPYTYRPVIVNRSQNTTQPCYVTRSRPVTRVTGTSGGLTYSSSSSSFNIGGGIRVGSSKASKSYNQLVW